MTATLDRRTHYDVLTGRLAELRTQRAETLREISPAGNGDDADRATNVDGHVKLALLDERIVALEVELAEHATHANRPSTGVVDIGDVVTVDLGDGPETYLFASVDVATEGMDVITPGSPLGRALLGAGTGATVEYSPRPRVQLEAKVIAIS